MEFLSNIKKLIRRAEVLVLIFVCLIALVLSLSACGATQVIPLQAQQGGGLTAPPLKDVIGSNGVVDSSTALTLEISQFCNAEAQVDYGWIAGFCGNAPNFQLPSAPVSVQTNIGTQIASQGKAAWCQANLWTGPSGQLSIPEDPTTKNPIIPTLGNCPTGGAPTPVTAPSGAAPAKS